MARVCLNEGDSFTFAGGNAEAQVFGVDYGVTLLAGAQPVSLSSGFETLTLAGRVSDYTYEQTGNVLNIYKDGDVLATMPNSPGQEKTLAFDNAEYALTVDLSEGFRIAVDDQLVSNQGPEPLNFSSAIDVVPADDGETFDLASIDDSTFVNFSAGEYAVTVDGFSGGDQLNLAGANAPLDQVSFNNADFSDGEVVIQAPQSSGEVIDITLTGLSPEQDSSIFDVNTFNTLFAEGLVA